MYEVWGILRGVDVSKMSATSADWVAYGDEVSKNTTIIALQCKADWRD